ncbi:hypothetical protein WJX73_006508 [Symbiochloris irregularis]|uniref:peptidylprolyl isomerase n=1 Tax=Symbiochloris irregularis TaxID=706552 RepID=A0AAW1NRQ5_9CHLO
MAHLPTCPASRTLQAPCTGSRAAFRATHFASFAAAAAALTFALHLGCGSVQAATLPEPTDVKVLCDSSCEAKIDSVQSQTSKTGLKYKDITVGNGASPPVGYQVTVDYVAMTPQGKIFDSSLEKGKPYDVRIGSGQIVPGLDEGIKGMKTGGLRRVYVPGNLAFPKGVASAPGRPRVPPSSPVVFDVKLLYIPGLSDDELTLE